MPTTKTILKTLFLGLLLASAAGSWAGAPLKFNFQGRLNENGQAAEGTKSFVFKIYGAQSGGSALWTSETQSIDVSEGVFTTVLSTGTPADLSTATFSGARYIEITVDGVPLSPRQEMVAAPYALVAQALAPDAELPPPSILAASVTDYHVLLSTSAISAGKFGDDRVAISTAAISGLGGFVEAGSETDPVFTAHPAYAVSATSITVWNASYGWGDHSSAGYAALSATQAFTGANTFASTAAFTAQSGSAPGVKISSGLVVLTGSVGIRLASPTSVLSVGGALSLPIKPVSELDHPYNITPYDSTLVVDASLDFVYVYLPSAAGIRGRMYTIKVSSASVERPVSLIPAAGETIGGAAGTKVITAAQDYALQSDGSNWITLLETTGLVSRTGDTMTGQLTLAGSTLTVAGSGFSVGGSTLVVTGGKVGIGAAPNSFLHVGGSLSMPIRTVSADYSVTGDDYTLLLVPDASPTITLPPVSGIAGRIYVIRQLGTAGASVLEAYPGDTIEGGTDITLNTCSTGGDDVLVVQTDGSAWYVISYGCFPA